MLWQVHKNVIRKKICIVLNVSAQNSLVHEFYLVIEKFGVTLAPAKVTPKFVSQHVRASANSRCDLANFTQIKYSTESNLH